VVALYERLNKIPERALKFGATLTKEELASWNNADIKPGQTPTQIRRNLDTRTDLAKKWLGQVTRFNARLGFPTDAIDALVGDELAAPEESMTEIIGAGVGAASGEDLPMPDGVDPADWADLSPEERQEYYELIGG
jgi:hypothetical protein